MPTPIEQLRNIGPQSAIWLRECGIDTIEDLRSLGVVATYRIVADSRKGISLNLLWALEAGLHDRDWRDISDVKKKWLRGRLQEVC